METSSDKADDLDFHFTKGKFEDFYELRDLMNEGSVIGNIY